MLMIATERQLRRTRGIYHIYDTRRFRLTLRVEWYTIGACVDALKGE